MTLTVDDFLHRFDGVTSAGTDQWTARCPVPDHNDRHASISLGLGDSGYLVHCHAGCSKQSILTHAGLAWADLFYADREPGVVNLANVRASKPAPAVKQQQSRQRDTEPPLPSADLIDLWAGDIDFVSHRLHELKGWTEPTLRKLKIGWDGQRITIPIPGPDGQLEGLLRYLPTRKPKMLAPRGGRRHLFPAPEQIRADRVWLVEGEPDAISMHELGVPGISVPGVATWHDPWAERLLHKRVTICMDADREGRQCAQDRAAQLHNYGVRTRIVDVAPDLDDGTDIGDLLAVATRQNRIGDLKAYLDRLEQQAWADDQRLAA